MNVQEINNIIAQAKNRYNSQKGQADGLLHDAQSLYTSTLANIIDTLLTEIAQLHAEIKKIKPDHINDKVVETVPVMPPKKKK